MDEVIEWGVLTRYTKEASSIIRENVSLRLIFLISNVAAKQSSTELFEDIWHNVGPSLIASF